MSMSDELLAKLPNTTIGVLINTLRAARDEKGKPAESMMVEVDYDSGESFVITVSRAKPRPLDQKPNSG